MKQRYSLRVSRAGEVIGEVRFNTTLEGLQQLIERIKPEFQYDILSADGIVCDHGYQDFIQKGKK